MEGTVVLSLPPYIFAGGQFKHLLSINLYGGGVIINALTGKYYMYSGSYSAEDISLIIGSGVTVESVDTYWKTFPDQDLSTAIGNVVGLKNGLGQERTEKYAAMDGSENTVIGGSIVDDSVTVTSEEKLQDGENSST